MSIGRRRAQVTFRRTDSALEIAYSHVNYGGSAILTVPWTEDFDRLYNSYIGRAPGEVKALMTIPRVKEKMRRVFDKYVSEMRKGGYQQ